MPGRILIALTSHKYARDAVGLGVLGVCGFLLYWKLTMTDQFTWLNNPDLTNQVMPWLQEQLRQWRSGQFPLWDKHHWAGYPLAGQGQPGILFPANWILALFPFQDGHVTLFAMNCYFFLLRYFGAGATYLLARDRGASVGGAIGAGIVYGFGGFVGGNTWPQMVNGAILAPLVFLFLMRSLKGTAIALNASVSGAILGLSVWSGHHQIAVFVALGCAFICSMFTACRKQTWLNVAKTVFCLGTLTILTALPQLLASREFYLRALRWVNTREPVAWTDKVPYFAHEQFLLPPGQAIALIVPHLYANVTLYLGGITVVLALSTVTRRQWEPWLWFLLGIAALLFSFGTYTPLHGVLYSLVPAVDKARNVAFGIVILNLCVAVLSAFGIDLIRSNLGLDRAWLRGLLFATVLPACAIFLFIGARSVVKPDSVVEADTNAGALAALSALGFGGIVWARGRGRLGGQTAARLLVLLQFVEAGYLAGYAFPHRERGWNYVNALFSENDTAAFLQEHLGAQRFAKSEADVPWNFGDWHGLDEHKGYMSPLTSVLRADHAAELLGVRYFLAKEPPQGGATSVFQSATGLHVYEVPNSFPRAWSARQLQPVATPQELSRAMSQDLARLRAVPPILGQLPSLQPCAAPQADTVQIAALEPSYTKLLVVLHCDG